MKRNNENLTKEELNLIEETEQFMKEVEADPEVKNVELPSDLQGKLMEKVRAKEAERAEKEETEELLRLGRIYKKRRKARKYWVIAAAAVLVLGFGVTAVGNKERISEIFHFDKLGRDQTQVNSGEGTIVVDNVSEEEVYQQIENEYGFYPVVMGYRPEGVEFKKMTIDGTTQTIVICYGQPGKNRIVCRILLNYRDNSHGVDSEENIINQYIMQVNGNEVLVKQFEATKEISKRWRIEYTNQNVRYSYYLIDIDQKEVEKIVNNLYF